MLNLIQLLSQVNFNINECSFFLNGEIQRHTSAFMSDAILPDFCSAVISNKAKKIMNYWQEFVWLYYKHFLMS